jgi:hypothetical protein
MNEYQRLECAILEQYFTKLSSLMHQVYIITRTDWKIHPLYTSRKRVTSDAAILRSNCRHLKAEIKNQLSGQPPEKRNDPLPKKQSANDKIVLSIKNSDDTHE